MHYSDFIRLAEEHVEILSAEVEFALCQIFIQLLIVYQFKHFVADFPLQGKYMLGKFKSGWEFFLPLLAHVAVHGAFTLTIVLALGLPHMWWLALVDMSIHFTMDRLKAGPKYLGRLKPLSASDMKASLTYLSWEGHEREKKEATKRLRGNMFFWWSLGLDQMVHHLTHYYIIYKLVTA